MIEDSKMNHMFQSRYEPAVPKEFKATIPPHLLAKLPEEERFLVETVSKLENQYDWLVSVVIKDNSAIQNLDSRVNDTESESRNCETFQTNYGDMVDTMRKKVDKLWDWKQFFSGKWAVLAGLAFLTTPVLVEFLFNLVAKWLKGSP